MIWRRRIALLTMVLAISSRALAQASAAAAERSLFESVNRERRARGLPALKWDGGTRHRGASPRAGDGAAEQGGAQLTGRALAALASDQGGSAFWLAFGERNSVQQRNRGTRAVHEVAEP